MVSVGLLSVGDHGKEQEGTGKEELEIFKGDLQFPKVGTGCDMVNSPWMRPSSPFSPCRTGKIASGTYRAPSM